MRIDDFVTHYQSKSDEELLQLAADTSLLTPEAHSALAGELSRRLLSTAAAPKGYPAAGQALAEELQDLLPARSHNTNEFIAEVLRLYHTHWRLFITLVAPAVVVGYTTPYLRRWLAMEIVRRIFSSQGPHTISTIEGLLVAVVGYVVSWMAFSCAFGAICISVHRIQKHESPTVMNSFVALRQRGGAFVRVSLLLFFLCAVANSAANLCFLRHPVADAPLCPTCKQPYVLGPVVGADRRGPACSVSFCAGDTRGRARQLLRRQGNVSQR